jgi:hypothetical protein
MQSDSICRQLSVGGPRRTSKALDSAPAITAIMLIYKAFRALFEQAPAIPYLASRVAWMASFSANFARMRPGDLGAAFYPVAFMSTTFPCR